MIKILSIITLSIISFGIVSCKKESKETQNKINPIDSTVALVEGKGTALVSNETSTSVALSEGSFNFGNIKKGDQVEHIYEITNTGKNPLIISEVRTRCSCTVPDFTKDQIMPGEKGKISLHFDSSSFEGKVQKYADVFANVEKSPIRLIFIADIQP